MKTICLVGYDRFANVLYDCLFSQGQIVTACTAIESPSENPFGLKYLGNENNPLVLEVLKAYEFFVCHENNMVRRTITQKLRPISGEPITVLHKSAIISRSIQAGEGVAYGPRVIVNSSVKVGEGVLIKAGAILDHGCTLNNYSNVGVGAIVCEGAVIGENATIGAGAVVLSGAIVPANAVIDPGTVFGNN